MRAGIYARVSREEMAAGYSIDTQLDAMRQYARDRGWQEIDYVESHTARTDDRPRFQQLMADAEAGLLDVVMVHRLDRGFRNLLDQLQGIARLRTAGVAFVSVLEAFDDSSSYGRLSQNLTGAINQFYSDELSEKTRRGKAARAKDGKSNASTTPYGYARDAEDGVDVPDPDTLPAVVLAFETYARGNMSDTDVAGVLNRAGYPPSGRAKSGRWTREGVRYLLTNRFYVGEVRHGRRTWYPGQHEPIVSQELFDQVQALRSKRNASRGGRRRSDRVYLLAGVGVCASCGLGIVSQTALNPGRRDVPQYFCPSRRRSVTCDAYPALTRADVVNEHIGRIITSLQLPEDWRRRLEELANHRQDVADVEGRRAYLAAKLRRLRELYLEGDYGKGEYDRLKAEMLAELESLRQPAPPEVEEAGVTLEALATAWQNAPVRLQSEMLANIFQEVRVDIPGRRVHSLKPWPPFVPLFRLNNMEERDGYFYPEDEPCNPGR